MRIALVLMAMILPAAPLLAEDQAMVHSPLGYDVPGAPGSAPAPAGAAASSEGVVALSPEAREATLEAAASRGNVDPAGFGKRAVHGEVGMMMGSHGTHALWGTAAVPLGDTGTAVVSVMTGSDNFRYRR